jgi:DNA-binding NtrC family response regulator
MQTSIIVIDNDENARRLLNRCLAGEDWLVSGYAYADIDLATLKQQHPDLIILDFTSDATDGRGWNVLQLLKMEETTSNIPVIITSTILQLSAEVRAYLLSRYIIVVYKPFDLTTFLALVQETLTQARHREGIFSSDRVLPILVVDDIEAMRDTLAEVLRLEGYQVITAFNGQVALDMVSGADHCLILLDIDMPIMTGLEFLTAYDRQLRPHTPVIIISGNSDLETQVLPSFVVDILRKPYVLNQLVSLVEKYAHLVEQK